VTGANYHGAMIRRIDLRDAEPSVDYRASVPRAEFDVEAATHAVRPVIEAVRTRGLDAVLEYTRQFDGVELNDIRVPVEALAEALAGLDPDVRAGLEESIRRLRLTCAAELESDVTTELGEGAVVTARSRSTVSASTSPVASPRWSAPW
jgi:histidinol dehydrogenase